MLALAWSWPLAREWSQGAPGFRMDPLLQAWTMGWVLHALQEGASLWHANSFHPAPYSLVYSDHLLGETPFFWAATRLGASPIEAFNAAWVAMVALAGWGAWLLARGVGLSWGPAVLAGIVFSLSPPRLGHVDHLQVMATAGYPLALYCWLRAESEGSWRWTVGTCLAITWQALCGGYHAVWVFVGFPALALLQAWRGGTLRAAARPLAAIGVALALVLPSLIPYLQAKMVIGHLSGSHPLWAAGMFSYLVASPDDRVWGWTREVLERRLGGESLLFPGLVALVLGWTALRQWPLPPAEEGARPSRVRVVLQRLILVLVCYCALVAVSGRVLIRIGADAEIKSIVTNTPASAAVLLGVLCVLLDRGLRRRVAGWLRTVPLWVALIVALGAMGFVLSYYLPSAALGAILPPYGSLRAPGRISLWFQLALAVLAAAGAARLASRGAWLVPLLCVLAFVEGLGVPMRIDGHPPEAPRLPSPGDLGGRRGDVYRWLGTVREPVVLLELPTATPHWDMFYQYASHAHWKPLVNGASGYSPRYWDSLRDALQTFPARPSLEPLPALGVTHVVVHFDGYTDRERDDVREALQREPLLKEVRRFGSDVVYALSPQAATVLGQEEDMEGLEALPREGWQASACVENRRAPSVGQVVDGKPKSGWSTGQAQRAGDVVTLDLGRTEAFDAVWLDLGSKASDYPRRWRVQTSSDGERWTLQRRGTFSVPIKAWLRAPLDPRLVIRLPRQVKAQYVRVVLEGSATAHWFVAEMGVARNRR